MNYNALLVSSTIQESALLAPLAVLCVLLILLVHSALRDSILIQLLDYALRLVPATNLETSQAEPALTAILAA